MTLCYDTKCSMICFYRSLTTNLIFNTYYMSFYFNSYLVAIDKPLNKYNDS